MTANHYTNTIEDFDSPLITTKGIDAVHTITKLPYPLYPIIK